MISFIFRKFLKSVNVVVEFFYDNIKNSVTYLFIVP